VLAEVEKEAEIIVWDGGNNDMPFIKPDLHFVVCDALRPGHEMWYYPGETNLRAADVVVINKSSENPTDVKRIRKNIEKANPNATVIEADMELTPSDEIGIYGKKVIVVEDGPTLTHGEMKYGAATIKAKELGAQIVDPRPYARGSIKELYDIYPHLGAVLPAVGYSKNQIKELSDTINDVPCDLVLLGTPTDIRRFMDVNKTVLRIKYEFEEIEKLVVYSDGNVDVGSILSGDYVDILMKIYVPATATGTVDSTKITIIPASLSVLLTTF